MNTPTVHCLTAEEFIAQGTSAAQVASIARYLATDEYGHKAQPDLAAKVRAVAEEVAALTGVRLYGKRGYYVRPRPANDNRRRKHRRAA